MWTRRDCDEFWRAEDVDPELPPLREPQQHVTDEPDRYHDPKQNAGQCPGPRPLEEVNDSVFVHFSPHSRKPRQSQWARPGLFLLSFCYGCRLCRWDGASKRVSCTSCLLVHISNHSLHVIAETPGIAKGEHAFPPCSWLSSGRSGHTATPPRCPWRRDLRGRNRRGPGRTHRPFPRSHGR